MAISRFLNPPEEAIDDSQDDVLEHVAATFSVDQRNAESDEEEDAGTTPTYTLREATAMLSQLKIYEEQQEQENAEAQPLLRRYERLLSNRRAVKGTQATIDSFFK